MELYLQLGHGMQGLSQELIKCWGKGTAIISPVNMPQAKLAPYAKKIHSIGGEVLFDPQMFYPKEASLKASGLRLLAWRSVVQSHPITHMQI